MYRTDTQFMKNPSTASSRIYIGNIAAPVVAADLEEVFKNHGIILGVMLRRGFAFIQYEKDSEAQLAIRHEHNSMFFGKRIIVRPAVGKGPSNFSQNTPSITTASESPSNVTVSRPRSSSPKRSVTPKPLMSNPVPPPKSESVTEEMDVNNEADVITDKVSEHEQDQQTHHSDFGSDTSDRRRFPRHNMNRNNRDHYYEQDRFSDFSKRDVPPRDLRDMPPRDLPPRDLPPRDLPPRDLPPRDMPPRDIPPREMSQFYGREDSYRHTFIPPPIDRPKRNDCEIIVVSRLLTEYAEYIESRLKSLGLMVDLLYPNEDVPIGRVLANISSTGCLYAILVMPQNEEFRSLTLSILHGIPQEHRNMPIEDAIILITRNFDAYMRGEKFVTSASGITSLTDRHPEQLQMLFNLLAENRQLSTAQYDRILKYLQERRKLQSQFEISERGSEMDTDAEPNSKQAELQNRILNILNKSNDETPKQTETSSGPTPLLNDPSVQKALDSLLSGDMFKSIGSGM